MRKLLLPLALLASVATASAQPLPSSGNGAARDGSLSGPNAPGRFYGATISGNPNPLAVANANRLFAMAVYIRPGSVLKTLSFNITTGNAAAWNARMCLYADNGQGQPGALVTDPGTVAIGSGSITGTQTATIAAGGVTLAGGWYWPAWMADSTSESISQLNATSAGPLITSRLMGWGSLAFAVGNTPTLGIVANQTFGACPANFPSITYGDNAVFPYVFMGY